ncbi:MAG: hypothetical protein OJF50_004483 [Nitrospira sp.]|nr:hypothetical protein [Nitrospira sp.]
MVNTMPHLVMSSYVKRPPPTLIAFSQAFHRLQLFHREPIPNVILYYEPVFYE